MRKLTAGLLGAAAVAASLVALRQPRPALRADNQNSEQATSKDQAGQPISLDRLRASGF